MWNGWEACFMFTWQKKWKKYGDVLAEGKITLLWLVNSNMVTPEQFDHLYLVHHFTVIQFCKNFKDEFTQENLDAELETEKE